MNTIEEHINSINAKLQLLIKKYVALQKENSNLNNENGILRKRETDHLQKIDSLEMQTGILKASAGKMNDEEKNDFEKRINQFIKDIDKCMAMLNN